MKSTVSLPEVGSQAEPKQDLRSQLAEYVAQQPASKQSFHKWMQILETASLAIPVAVFAVALYLSFAWKTVPTQAIPAAWLSFPLSFAPFLILVGLHAIGLRAFPPTHLLGKTMRIYLPVPGQVDKMVPLRVGGKAVAWGWGTVVAALVIGAFWGVFAWAVWTVNVALLTPLITFLGYALGIAIAGSIIFSIFRDIYRRITRFR
ncbi:MAG: hypothetical protein NT169_23345 [Chloroflexi bacterium]|nr:hypothetical protein [Chloroflexota bacterium]